MRIIYDDKYANMFVKILHEKLQKINPKSITQYEWGMERAQIHLIKQSLNDSIASQHMEIGNKADHAYGIGNNNAYPVYYKNDPQETQIMCYINMNDDGFGSVIIYVTDFNNNKISETYDVSKWGVKRK